MRWRLYFFPKLHKFNCPSKIIYNFILPLLLLFFFLFNCLVVFVCLWLFVPFFPPSSLLLFPLSLSLYSFIFPSLCSSFALIFFLHVLCFFSLYYFLRFFSFCLVNNFSSPSILRVFCCFMCHPAMLVILSLSLCLICRSGVFV